MTKHTHSTRWILILAAATFWLSWWLMPDAGTADAAHILTIVRQHRGSVLASVIIQIASSVAYVVALLLIVRACQPRPLAMTGAILFGVGAMGMCADAFFHMLAFTMTSDTVSMQPDVVQTMTLMQTQGVALLVPILLPFFIGSLVMALGFARQGAMSRGPWMLFAAAFIIGIAGGILFRKVLGVSPQPVVLATLALFAVGHAWTGIQLMPQS